jgi:phage gp29-like protein
LGSPSLIKEVKGKGRKPQALAPIAVPAKELQYRQISDGWTPKLVKAAFGQAEAGSMLLLADLVETMFTDDRISGVLKTRTHGLLGLPLHFEGGTEEQRLELAGASGSSSGLWDDMVDEAEAARLQAWGLLAGVGLAQRVPVPRRFGEPQRYTLETWSPRWLTYDATASSGSTWRINTRAGTKPLIPGIQWVLYTPYGAKRPWAAGEWRALAFPWLLKHFALEDRANHSEVMGTPTRVGKAPQGATERGRNTFQAQIKALGRSGTLVLPEGWEYAITEATGRTWEIYSEGVKWADEAITIILAGQIVTTEGSQGFSSGNVQDQIKGDLLRFDAKALGKCLNKQFLGPWSFVNTGTYSAPLPCWNTERPVNLMNQATGWETISRAVPDLNKTMAADGIAIDMKALAGRYNMPIKPIEVATKEVGGITLAPTSQDAIVSVNEGRQALKLPSKVLPNGAPDPAGDITIAEATAKAAAKAAGTGMPPGVSVTQHSQEILERLAKVFAQ